MSFALPGVQARYKFASNMSAEIKEGFTVNDMAFTFNDDVSKRITASVIRSVNADILCLQEVCVFPSLSLPVGCHVIMLPLLLAH